MLDDLLPAGVALLTCDGEATRLLEAWTGAATAIVIDAVAGGAAAPGTLHRLVVTADPVLGDAVLGDRCLRSRAPARTTSASARPWPWPGCCGGCRARLILHGIQGADFSNGVALSPPVAARIGDLTAAVLADIRASTSRSG